jgi:hypothetical protein
MWVERFHRGEEDRAQRNLHYDVLCGLLLSLFRFNLRVILMLRPSRPWLEYPP